VSKLNQNIQRLKHF